MRHTRRMIDETLATPFSEIFESFDAEPLGSGCVAQVHRAVLREEMVAKHAFSSRDVVVKVIHPKIK
ncbi:hypothetical protein SARC_15483, partial [Sphaeroforma arctica JP610]